MLNNAIKKNKRYLRFCAGVAQFAGLFMFCFGVISIVIFLVSGGFQKPDSIAFFYKSASPMIFKLIFPGLFLLGIKQLIKYLIDVNVKPNWILRFSDKLIYLYVALVIINFIYYLIHPTNAAFASEHHYLTICVSTIFLSVRLLLWIALAHILRTIIPIIDESKTLV